jgi:hypothetical protein
MHNFDKTFIERQAKHQNIYDSLGLRSMHNDEQASWTSRNGQWRKYSMEIYKFWLLGNRAYIPNFYGKLKQECFAVICKRNICTRWMLSLSNYVHKIWECIWFQSNYEATFSTYVQHLKPNGISSSVDEDVCVGGNNMFNGVKDYD